MISPQIQAQIDALQQAFMGARGGGEDFRVALPDLPPELLAYIQSMQATPHSNGVGATRGLTDSTGANFLQNGLFATIGGSPDSQSVDTDPSRIDWSQSPIHFGVNSDVSNYVGNYDNTGKFQGYEVMQDDHNWTDTIISALMLAPAVAGVYGAAAGATAEGGAAAGVGGGSAGGGGAGGAAAGSSSITLPTTAEVAAGMTPATWQSAMGPLANTLAAGGTAGAVGAAGAGGAAGGGGAGGSAASASELGTTGVNSMRAGEIASYGTNGSLPSSAATVGGNMSTWDWITNALGGSDGWASTLAKLGMAAYGAHEAKDQQQTVNREPWGPAQGLLKGLIGDTANLYGQYKANPFSDAQKTAYGNQAGLLNMANQMAPGLLSGMQANASGANAYDRMNPRRGLTGANPQGQWQPGLLNYFGG
jgi:hypothetical protein